MASLEDELRGMAQDNSETGVSFSAPSSEVAGKKFFATRAEMEAAAFPIKAAQAPALLKASTPVEQVPAAKGLLDSIDAQLKAAIAAPSPMEAAQNLGNVRGSIAKEDARFFKEAQATAYAEYQIPQLEATLQQNINMDRSTPAYVQKYGMADSDETKAIRSQLMTAKSAADATINERLSGNTTYQELKAKAKTIESLITHQVTKGLDRDANLEAKASEFYYSIQPEQKAVFDKAIGNSGSDPRVALASIARMTPQERGQLESVMQQGDRAVPSLALQGNLFARRIALDNETKVFGDKDVAAKKMSELDMIATDNKIALATFKQMKQAGIFVNTPEMEARTKALEMNLGVGAISGDKQAKEAAARDRQFIAQEAAKFKTKIEFNSDIIALRHKSQAPVPAWLELAAADPAVGKIDKTKAIQLANKTPNIKERQTRLAELVAFYDSAVQNQNKSLYFTVPPLATEQLKAEATLMGVFGETISKLGGMLPSFSATPMTGEKLQNYMQQSVGR